MLLSLKLSEALEDTGKNQINWEDCKLLGEEISEGQLSSRFCRLSRI